MSWTSATLFQCRIQLDQHHRESPDAFHAEVGVSAKGYRFLPLVVVAMHVRDVGTVTEIFNAQEI